MNRSLLMLMAVSGGFVAGPSRVPYIVDDYGPLPVPARPKREKYELRPLAERKERRRKRKQRRNRG